MEVYPDCFTGYSKRSTGCLKGSESMEAVIRRNSSRHWPRQAFGSRTTPRFLEFAVPPWQRQNESQWDWDNSWGVKNPVKYLLLPYPVSCRCSWSVWIYVQVNLQKNHIKIHVSICFLGHVNGMQWSPAGIAYVSFSFLNQATNKGNVYMRSLMDYWITNTVSFLS